MRNNRPGKFIFIRNLLTLPAIYSFLLKSVRDQKRFLKKEMEPYLEPFRRENDGSLTEADFKKITSYYAMGVPAILGESLCILRGVPMTKKERLCMSYLGGISGLLDDLFDDPEKSADNLSEFISHPEGGSPRNRHEGLLKHLYIKGLSYAPHPDKIKQVAHEVFQAQQKSLTQKGPANRLNISELTFLKGGNSFKYYRLCLSHDLDLKEEKMIFQLGGLLQLGNDIFDVWEDARDGIATISTTTPGIKLLREKFKRELEKTHSFIKATEYEPLPKKKFQRIINLAIARVFVCLDQFEELESSTGGEFLTKRYSRKQLICDMQKPVNQFKAIHYYLKTSFRN